MQGQLSIEHSAERQLRPASATVTVSTPWSLSIEHSAERQLRPEDRERGTEERRRRLSIEHSAERQLRQSI